jgi:hypothetical protein
MRLALLAATTAALPLLVPQGPGNTAPVDIFAALFVVVVFAEAVIARRRMALPAVGPLLLVALVSSVAVLFSVHPSTGLLNLLIEAYLVAFLWAVCNELRGRPDRMALITSVWVAAACIWAFLLVGTAWHFLPTGLEHLLVAHDTSGRAAAAAKNPNLAASFMVTSIFVTMASPWPRSHIVRGGIYALLLTAIFDSGSNGALLGVIVGTLVVVGLRLARRSSYVGRKTLGAALVVTLGVGIFAVVAAAPTVNQGTADKLAQSSAKHGAFKDNLGRVNHSVASRVALWSSALKGGFNHSAVGVGVGEGQTIQVNDTSLGKSLHNDVLAFLLERGIVGLLALILLMSFLFRWTARLARAGPVVLNGQLWRMQAFAGAMAATIAVSLTHESYHFRHIWMLFALIWVAADLVAAPKNAEAETLVEAMPETLSPVLAVPARGVRVPA